MCYLFFVNSIQNLIYILYFLFFSACLVVITAGIVTVWISPIVWKLKQNSTEINPLGEPVTTLQIAWIGGLAPFGGLVGTMFVPELLNIFGRKRTLMIISFAVTFLEALLAFATNIYVYYLARLMIGVFVGSCPAVVSVFLSEISEDHNRGILGCFVGLSYPLGTLYGYLIGPMFTVKMYTLLGTIPNIITILCCLAFIPESPYYLASKGHKKETLEALQRIRTKNIYELEKEYENIIQTLEITADKVEATWRDLFNVRCLRRGLVITVGLNAIQQLSGINAILGYAGILFDASNVSLSGDVIAILIGLVNVFGVLLAMIVIEKVGRRPLLLVSTLGGSVSLLVLGLFFYLKKFSFMILNTLSWVPVTSALLFIVFFAVGLASIPVSLPSELFPVNAKSKISSACAGTTLTFMFAVITLFPILNDCLGPAWCFCLFSIFGFLGFLFIHFLVPEIKGKSLVEIQEVLSK